MLDPDARAEVLRLNARLPELSWTMQAFAARSGLWGLQCALAANLLAPGEDGSGRIGAWRSGMIVLAHNIDLAWHEGAHAAAALRLVTHPLVRGLPGDPDVEVAVQIHPPGAPQAPGRAARLLADSGLIGECQVTLGTPRAAALNLVVARAPRLAHSPLGPCRMSSADQVLAQRLAAQLARPGRWGARWRSAQLARALARDPHFAPLCAEIAHALLERPSAWWRSEEQTGAWQSLPPLASPPVDQRGP